MKSLAILCSLIVTLTACQSGGGGSDVSWEPGHGKISMEVIPNPIVARAVRGNVYDFPVEIVVRENGGHAVNVTGVSLTVLGPVGLVFHRESWDAEKIRALGYSTTVAANGELRYRFVPRQEVPDERLFGGVVAELRVEAIDAAAKVTSATTSVTVSR